MEPKIDDRDVAEPITIQLSMCLMFGGIKNNPTNSTREGFTTHTCTWHKIGIEDPQKGRGGWDGWVSAISKHLIKCHTRLNVAHTCHIQMPTHSI